MLYPNNNNWYLVLKYYIFLAYYANSKYIFNIMHIIQYFIYLQNNINTIF